MPVQKALTLPGALRRATPGRATWRSSTSARRTSGSAPSSRGSRRRTSSTRGARRERPARSASPRCAASFDVPLLPAAGRRPRRVALVPLAAARPRSRAHDVRSGHARGDRPAASSAWSRATSPHAARAMLILDRQSAVDGDDPAQPRARASCAARHRRARVQFMVRGDDVAGRRRGDHLRASAASTRRASASARSVEVHADAPSLLHTATRAAGGGLRPPRAGVRDAAPRADHGPPLRRRRRRPARARRPPRWPDGR